jgi:nucleoside kinase
VTAPRDLDVLSVGSWAIFDHLARLAAYPLEGQTIRITSDMEPLLEPCFGDCSANVAAVAAALGARTGLAMVVGGDFVDSGYADHLSALGVDLAAVEVRPGATSGHNFLYSDDAGDGFCLSHLGVAADQRDWRVPAEHVARARSVVVSEMFGPYTLGAIRAARRGGAMTVVNGMIGTAGDAVAEFLRHTDVLFIAASELRDLLATLGLREPAALLDHGPRRLFVTHGRRGSETWGEDGRTPIDAVAADRVVDTTGAGDAFAAGTLTALLRGMEPAEAGAVGATTASFIVEAWGAQTHLPTWADMSRRRTERAASGRKNGAT